MKYIVIFLFLPFLASSQNKGVSPIANSQQQTATKNTYAVVIGISDYQEPGIPDLRYADKDAEAFANFLRSPAGGSLNSDQLQVLTNSQATAGRIAEALDALIEKAKQDDQVIIYFSGHGDVEGKKLTQPGFLLCWDSPSRVYMGGGTYSLSFLQEVVSTLSVQNQAKVVVITDACHAGKLAGNQIGGAQLTTANLAKQYANEMKILSCQPNEYSLEGPQWGGGRGVFSYHLVDGLFGLADRNNDGQVSLGEIDRYLEDHVTAEAAPQSQVPILLGNKTDRLATVNASILADLKKNKTGSLVVFASTESRGFEDEILAKADTNVVLSYKKFKQAILEKRFLSPEDNCAESYYAQLEKVEILAPLRGIMKRNYAAALQDDAQQTLNKTLKTKQDETVDAKASERLPRKVFAEKVRLYPRCLERAAELLGEKHYMYATLMARKYFFEGYLLTNSNLNPNQELGERSIALFRKSLAWQPEQPHVYWQMSIAFAYNLRQSDSLEYYSLQATRVHPNWVAPSTAAAYALSYVFKKPNHSKLFLEQASRIDSSSPEVLDSWGFFNFLQKNFVEAEAQFKKAIVVDSTYTRCWQNLGLLYDETHRYSEAEQAYKKAIALDSTYIQALGSLGAIYHETRRYPEAEQVYKKAIMLDTLNYFLWNNLGSLYTTTRRYPEAEQAIKKAIALDSTHHIGWDNLGKTYVGTSRNAEAELCFKKAIMLDSSFAIHWINLGYVYRITKRYIEAESVLKKAILLDSTNYMAWTNLAAIYIDANQSAEAEQTLKKCIELDSASAFGNGNLGVIYLRSNRLHEARLQFLKVIELVPNAQSPYTYMAALLCAEGKITEAIDYVEQAISKGRTFEKLEKDEDLAQLRALPEWRTLMKKHFPDKIKD